jgi:hypothetical protein
MPNDNLFLNSSLLTASVGTNFIAAGIVSPAITFRSPDQTTEVFRINPDGRLFWHGSEVRGDADFRAAMLELRDAMCGPRRV